MSAAIDPVILLDDLTLRGMQIELTTDLAAFFQGSATNDQRVRLNDWLDSIQPPSTIARLAAQAAAAVLVAFERGYTMAADQREASDGDLCTNCGHLLAMHDSAAGICNANCNCGVEDMP